VAYIKRIEISGFKSFGARKVTLNLDRGFTAIVGQNGSGKSNILDAVCFVLGRLSSKSLRAENFASLIFHGADGYPAAKSCRVTLVFDNRDRQFPVDADELAISREVDTTGVSAYRINGRRCTRTELLDTIAVAGLHPEGYNIVMQNELPKVVAMSPAEIRQVVENIAGISAFDEKKRRIEEELAKVDANLRIVEMRTEEIRQEYERLERDRRDALRWQELTQEMARVERDMAFAELARIEENLSRMREEHDSLVQEITHFREQGKEARERRARLEEEYTAARRQLKTLDTGLRRKELEITRLREKLSGLEITATQLSHRTESITSGINHLKASVEDAKERYSQLEKLVEKLRGEEANLKKKIEPLRAQLSQLAERVTHPDAEYLALRKEITGMLEVIESKQKKLAETTAQLRVAEKSIQNLQHQIGESRTLLEQQEHELEEQRKKRDAAEATLKRKEEELAKIRDQQKENSTAIVERMREQKELSALIQEVREKLLQLQTRVSTIREFKKLGLSRQAAIEAILRFAKEQGISGIYGTLGSLGKTSTEYATALEIAGGSKLDFIVVDSEETATKCIDFLKKERIGRATFIPLNSIRSRSLTYKGPRDGVVGAAINLLTFDERFRPAFEYAFGRALIVKDLAVARGIDAPGFRKITLEGDVVEPSRVMTGGYYKPISSLTLEEEARIPELQRKLKELQDLHRKADGEYRRLKEASDRIEEQARKVQREIDDLQREIESITETMLEREERLTAFRESVNNLQEELQRAESARLNLLQKLREEQDAIDQLTARRKALEQKLTEIESSGITLSMHQLRTELDQLEHQLSETRLQLTEKIGEMRHVRTEWKRLESDLQKSLDELRSAESELQRKEQEIASLRKQLATLEREQNQLESKINELEQQLEENEAEQRRLTEFVEELNTKIGEKQISCSKLEERIATWEERLASQREKVSGLEPPLEPISPSRIYELRKRYAALEREREALGLINQKAVERFEEIKEAYAEILEKRSRIQEERQAILDALRRAEEEKTRVFMETFNSISRNFSQVYRQLSEGEGYLELENPENPFLGGIRMKVRPAGKRVTYIDSLSGGEKALASLAFIFALQLHQPAPFYFLDEIDESLDAQNADRVARLIVSLSENSQFIVITHNEITMRYAPILFGVTQVNGVSQVFAVKFEEGMLLIDSVQRRRPRHA